MLITLFQIKNNLRRTAQEGLISLLNQEQLEQLALKHYGKFDSNGKLIGYQCPYSGEIITNFKDIVLEHIIPVSSTGGTILFNCIPTSKKVNGLDEKGANHLLKWWKDKNYYSPEKLNKLLKYIFEAYDIVFENNTIEEVENSYNDIDLSETKEEKADLTTTSKEEKKKLKEQVKNTGVISYYGFINDCIDELKDNGYNVSKYEEKIKEYEEKNIFKETEKFTKYQRILKKIIKTKLEEDDRSELTYMLNVNIGKLMNSMKDFNNEKEIYEELLNRINNIEFILEQNNIGIISFLEDIKNHDILYKTITEITEEDITKLIDKIKLCVNDKFNHMISFVIENKGKLPSQKATDEREKVLGQFRSGIQKVTKKGNFSTSLKKNQLEYLHNSENEALREIYKVILNKAIKNNIIIEYIDEDMKKRIEEFNEKVEGLSIEEQIKLEQEYKDVIIIDSQFNEMISFVIENKGKLPSQTVTNEREKVLSQFRSSIQSVTKKGNFYASLKKNQLEYLHNSENEALREIYKVILNKVIKNNIIIEYIDEDMKKRIEEFNEKVEGLSIEEQIKLEQEYKDVIIIDSQFNEMISFVIENKGKLPSTMTKDEREKVLGQFRNNIQSVTKKGSFNASLKKNQLEYLHNSENKALREIYKVILNKAIKNNITIEYIDEDIKKRIEEFNEKVEGLSIEEQIKLEQEYKDVIIIDSQFNEMISFVIENKGKLPSTMTKDGREKVLGQFRSGIQKVTKKGNFSTSLKKNQLEYLHNSENEALREIYKVILNKAIKNNIIIEYIDEDMKKRIEEFNEKVEGLSIEEQIKLEQEYKDVIIIDSQFNEMISFVIENKGKLPSTKATDEREEVLGRFRNSIQNVRKEGTFGTSLKKNQLEYLHNSENEALREIYKVILNKAIKNNITIEYIDEDMKKRIEEFNEKVEGLSIEEQIKLEQEYKDVIIIDSQFNEMISFVIENKGKLPSTMTKDEREKVLGRFRNSIQSVTKNGTFHASLKKNQLEYLHNSENEGLREIYDNIMIKAYIINYQDYIEMDSEFKSKNMKGRIL